VLYIQTYYKIRYFSLGATFPSGTKPGLQPLPLNGTADLYSKMLIIITIWKFHTKYFKQNRHQEESNENENQDEPPNHMALSNQCEV